MATSYRNNGRAPRTSNFSAATSATASPRTGFYATPPHSTSSASLARLGRSGTPSGTSTAAALDSTGGSRKRARPDASARPASPSHNRYLRTFTSSHFSSSHPSPPPLTNTSFRLAGGRESPSSYTPRDSTFSHDRDFRRAWSPSAASTSSADGRRVYSLGALDREHNGRKRSRPQMADASPESWTQYVVRLAGGFAGAVWDFCKPDGFQGFAAGGGTAYAMTDGAPHLLTPERRRVNYPHIYRDDDDMRSTPVPGGFPTDDDDYYVKISAHVAEEEQGRPSKRQQTTQGNDWVVVDQAKSTGRSSTGARPSPGSPYRTTTKVPRPVAARATPLRRPRSLTSSRASVSSASLAGTSSNAFDSLSPRTASFAKQRTPTATPQRSPQTSPRSRSSLGQNPSPQSVEIQRYSARQERQKRENDASMRRLNQQMQDMIRQGQEALSSPVRYDDMMFDEEDEGYGEGEYDTAFTKI